MKAAIIFTATLLVVVSSTMALSSSCYISEDTVAYSNPERFVAMVSVFVTSPNIVIKVMEKDVLDGNAFLVPRGTKVTAVNRINDICSFVTLYGNKPGIVINTSITCDGKQMR